MIKHNDNLKVLVSYLKDSVKLVSRVPVISKNRNQVT